MILYHGSNQVIDRIDLSKSRPNKDFGRAFYLSPMESQAMDMAYFRVMLEGGMPTLNTYSFEEGIMKSSSLKVLCFTSYSEEWAKFVLANRDAHAPGNIHDYDIVYGPIANDSVGRQIANLKEGYITFDEFLNRLKFMKGITFQYAFCTNHALSKLVRL